MSQLLTIENNKIVIQHVALTNVDGDVTHCGTLNVTGPSKFLGNLDVANVLTADTLKVKNIETDSGWSFDMGAWKTTNESELNGKGFSWSHGGDSVRLIYRNGGRLWANADLDLFIDKTYQINGETVIGGDYLGPQVRKSNLEEVGTLKKLSVDGDVSLAKFVNFHSNLNRVAINAIEAHSALTVVENDVELVVGSTMIGVGVLGVHSNHNLAIITDNTPRIVVKNSGEVVFGNESSRAANVTIYGSLTVDNIISDTKSETFSSVEFKGDYGSPIYDKGLIWSGTGGDKELVMKPNPDRLWSSQSIDIDSTQTYRVNNKVVLSETELGFSVTKSYLTELGRLSNLDVEGTARFYGDLVSLDNPIIAKTVSFNQGTNIVELTDKGWFASQQFKVTIGSKDLVQVNETEVLLGDKENANKAVKVFGTLSVGVNSPDPNFGLVVKGNVMFANKKFINGDSAPTTGYYSRGDICWNNDPRTGSYIGWVCIGNGNPGTWTPFGKIE